MTTALISYYSLLLLLLLLFCCYCRFAVATTKLLLLINICEQELFPGAVELTTQFLRLASILWFPLCRINKLGNTTREDCCDPLYLWVIMVAIFIMVEKCAMSKAGRMFGLDVEETTLKASSLSRSKDKDPKSKT